MEENIKRLLIGAVLLGAVGCKSSTSHTLDADVSFSIPGASYTCVSGPFHIPGGDSTSYSITDSSNDSMDIAVVVDGTSCDATSSGQAYTPADGNGTFGASAIDLYDDSYDLAITCLNPYGYPCLPYLNSWTDDD